MQILLLAMVVSPRSLSLSSFSSLQQRASHILGLGISVPSCMDYLSWTNQKNFLYKLVKMTLNIAV